MNETERDVKDASIFQIWSVLVGYEELAGGMEPIRNGKTFRMNNNGYCYINTTEIPGELLPKNKISSHVKITCYLPSHMKRSLLHCCYGYIINRLLEEKKVNK